MENTECLIHSLPHKTVDHFMLYSILGHVVQYYHKVLVKI